MNAAADSRHAEKVRRIFRDARLVLSLASATLVLACLAGSSASAAWAQTNESLPLDGMLISVDGVTFSVEAQHSLFDGSQQIVPGGTVSSSLWVQNPTDSGATVRIVIRQPTTSSQEYAHALLLTASNSQMGGGTASSAFDRLQQCTVLTTVDLLPAHDTVRVDFALALARDAPRMVEHNLAHFELLIEMHDAADHIATAAPCGRGGVLVSGGGVDFEALAPTGSGASIPVALTCALALGLCLLFASRWRTVRRHARD